MTLQERFWAKVDKSAGPEGCWLWMAGLRKSGNGQFHIPGSHPPRSEAAHRVSYSLAHGPLAADAWVAHSCREPTCVNPAHLFLRLRTEDAFWARVERSIDPSACWLWRGSLNASGYGRYEFKGQKRPAHRLAYEFLIGAIPDGLVIDHLCRVPSCVNPDHLEPVTPDENNRRRDAFHRQPGRMWHPRAECPEGHPLNGDNLIVHPSRPTRRRCRTCEHAKDAARRERKRLARLIHRL